MMRSPRSPHIAIKYRKNRSISPFIDQKDKNIKKFVSNQLGDKIPPIPGDLETVKSYHVLILDLSENKLTPKSLKDIGPNVSSLNLSKNPLNSVQLPLLERLRTLYLDDCELVSLSRFPPFPNLRLLSLQNNKISDFKNIPYFPKLETINLLGNPISRKCPIHLIIASLGSINLKKINNIKLTLDLYAKAYELSPLVGYAIRHGRSAVSHGNESSELASSQDFLTTNLTNYCRKHRLKTQKKLIIEESNGNHFIKCPFESQSIKWYCHSQPENGSEWVEIQPTKNPSVLAVTMSIRLHLIKCDFLIEKKKYSLYTDYPIGKGKHDYSLPFPIHPKIEGIPSEGSLINCLPLPIPTHIAWIKENSTLAKDTRQILLTSKEINQSVACIMQPYCKFNEGIGFSTIFSTTDTIKPVAPIVSGISFPETIMEDEVIKFERFIFPDREGKSIITIEKSFSPSGEWGFVDNIDPKKLQYRPKGTDVNYYLRLTYKPILDDGIEGETRHFYSQSTVLSTVPTFKNPYIAGVPKTCYPLVAIADYSGGIPGDCTCEWFFSKRPIDTKKGPSQRLQKVARNTLYFTPTEEMAEGYLAVLMTPVRNDDVYGDPIFFALDTAISLNDPPKPFEVPKEAIVGQKMKFPCVCDVLLSKTSGFCGFDFLKTGNTYTPREKHVGRIVRVVNETGDMIIGPIKLAKPVVLTVKISAEKWQVSYVANIHVTHKSCKPEQLEILWLRVGPNYEKAVAINTPEYVIQPEDASFQIQAVVTPIDDENHKKDPFFSDLSPVIKSDNYSEPTIVGDLMENGEVTINAAKDVDNVIWYRHEPKNQYEKIGEGVTFKLSSKDVGRFIRAKVILKSGIVVYTETKTTVEPCIPTVEVSLPKKVLEGDFLEPVIKYQGGVQGKSEQRWYRETDDGWEFVTDELNYKVTSIDIDSILRFVYIPHRNDGERGQEVITECGPVDPLPPTAKNVTIKQNENGNLEVNGTYIGGEEGKSFIIWRVYDDNNMPKNVGKTFEYVIPPDETFNNKTVDAVYVPIRFDGAGGQPVPSKNKIFVKPLPSVEKAEILVKKGKVIEGNLMRCNVKLSNGATPQYQWYHGDGKAWEKIENATEAEYLPNQEDVGYYILCSIVAVNKKNWKSEPYAATTLVPLAPAPDKLTIISSAEKIMVGMIISVKMELSKKNTPIWQREVDDKWENVLNDDNYVVTCNDIGHRLRVISTNGLESKPTNVIEMEQVLALYIKAMLRTSSLTFTGYTKLGNMVWMLTASPYGLTMETAKGTKKKSKWNLVQAVAIDGTVDEMILWMDPSSKFIMIPSFDNDPRLQALIRADQVRDYVVMVLLGLKEKHQK